jgi:hypothetical protein
MLGLDQMKVFLALFVVAVLVPFLLLGMAANVLICHVWNWAIAK